MTEQERAELIADARENEAIMNKSEIRRSIWAIKAHVDLIRLELTELEGRGVRVDQIIVKGPHDDFQAEHADMRVLSGMMNKVAEALGEQVRPWCTVTPREKQITLQDMTIRGPQS